MASEAPKMTVASYMTLLNVKANHRKAVVTEKEAMVTSSNPHDASGFHGNIALKVTGPIINDILKSEEAVSLFSGGPKLPRVEVKEIDGQYRSPVFNREKNIRCVTCRFGSNQKKAIKFGLVCFL